MDPPSIAPNSGPDEENQRVKFLCSFSGSVMPRPHDGKLRYVGGETRMVSVCRGIKYEELMVKMRELYESAALLKYQQPDEDLDALVSVVNDEDVTNMMEEYDKLLLSVVDGSTRLRIFLFSLHDLEEFSSHLDMEGKDTGSGISRYVDALNSLPDSSDQMMNSDLAETDLLLHQFNLRNLAVPRLDQRYSEVVEPVRSPAFHDPLSDFSSSPSSALFQQMHSPRVSDNLMWFPPGERGYFPVNLHHHGSNFMEGSSRACEHCWMNVQRNKVYSDEHLCFQQHSGNSPPLKREAAINLDPKLLHDSYMKGQGCPSHCESQYPPHVGTSNFSNYSHHHHIHHHQDVFYDQAEMGRSYSPMSHEEENATFFNSFSQSCRVVDATHQGPYSYLHQTSGGTSPRVIRGTPESSPRFCFGKDGQNMGFDGYVIPSTENYPVGYTCRMNPAAFNQGNQQNIVGTTDDREPQYCMPSRHVNPMVSQTGLTSSSAQMATSQQLNQPTTPRGFGANFGSSCVYSEGLESGSCVDDMISEKKMYFQMEMQNKNNLENAPRSSIPHIKGGRDDMIPEVHAPESMTCTILKPLEGPCIVKPDGEGTPSPLEDLMDGLSSIRGTPGLGIKVSIKGCEEEKDEVHNQSSPPFEVSLTREDILLDIGTTVNGNESKDTGSGKEQNAITKIEPTKAEEEALSRGLQTIKNDDLEEIRELGSGTYGAVYHGKWRGSDVAVKRIKASCFSGKPSERERLITDFWKEALILSSLHHPNVVSFYGIVRDGPDGSLATVTEFMVNGSLKQFLHKKDRTVDRRKRLIIGMDVAFGMEYLHGKNIVHFDLKCENLLVNMRDPQRPVCKIGDLGLSKVKRSTLVSGGIRGTLPWMAPELLSGKSGMVTEKIDVYSFGIVMWELLTGEDPYSEMHCASIIGGIVKNELRPEVPTWCDPEWKGLMESCWASEPAQRPSFSHISQKLRAMGAAMNLK